MNSFKELLTIILAIKVNVKKQRRYDRSMVIFKLKDRNFLICACIINFKNANEIRTKNSKIFTWKQYDKGAKQKQ